MLKKLFIRIAPLLLGFATSFPAAAHYLWIERDTADPAKLYFGEFQEGLREAKGGRLDEIKGPQAWALTSGGEKKEIKVAAQPGHFDLDSGKTAFQVIAQESNYEVKDWSKYGHGVVKPMYYARFTPIPAAADGKPELALDILPRAKSFDTFTVHFHGEPLPNAKVMVYAPNMWMQERKTDESGRVKINTPWPGQYVLEVIHTEKQPGEFQGQKFEGVRHRATLTFMTKAKAHGR